MNGKLPLGPSPLQETWLSTYNTQGTGLFPVVKLLVLVDSMHLSHGESEGWAGFLEEVTCENVPAGRSRVE